MASSEKFHFEKNTIVTSTTNINKSDVEKYIVENLDNFREGSHFIVMCGFHGSPEGKLLEYDPDFMSQYKSMFNSINRKHENKIKERKYLMGQTIVLSPVPKKGLYDLAPSDKNEILMKFKNDFVKKDAPYVFILATCHSYINEVNNILRSYGLYAALRISEDRGELTNGRIFQLDEGQKHVLQKIVEDHKTGN